MAAPRASDRPEVLAPVGDRACLEAALAAGADAVYFGLDEGFHARAKAVGFSLDSLASTVQDIHRAGTKAYVTVNTLVFEDELEDMAEMIRGIAKAGVDAIIVQDPAVCRLAQVVAPGLTLHASTQMTISSPEAARFAQALGVKRVVVPRELSLRQIERFAADTELELEVFVHGALCMSWSGQCLSGEAWLGRSANRGQCNQGCRLPYELLVDGELQPLGEHRYLLSPKDLAAVEQVDALAKLGVVSLKIEGRYKGPAYVSTNVELYRGLVDAKLDSTERDALVLRSEMIYSRGFSPGHLGGSAHQDLVDGRFPKHRGRYLGTVVQRKGSRVWVDCAREETGRLRLAQWPVAPVPGLTAGCGIVVDAGRPQDRQEAGGRVHGVAHDKGAIWVLNLGPRGSSLHKIEAGHRVWLSAPAQLKPASGRGAGKGRSYALWASGQLGEPLVLRACCGDVQVQVQSQQALLSANATSLDGDRLREKVGFLAKIGLHLTHVHTQELAPGLFLPPSQLKHMRRELITRMETGFEQSFEARLADARPVSTIIQELRARAGQAQTMDRSEDPRADEPHWVVLCRTMEQLEACIEAGIREVDLDWMEFVGLSGAVQRAKAAGLVVNIATVRVQKPGEEGYDRRIAALAPDGVLVRHFAALSHFHRMDPERRPRLHGDFSLNCTNSVTAHELLRSGLDTLTVSHDLNDQQVLAMIHASPDLPLTLTLHHHLALFHNDHCIYAKYLSHGQDFRTCKRPCDRHKIHLRDHLGHEHPVIVDVECRNTVFSAQAQSAAGYLQTMRDAGITRYRVEFAWESKSDARTVLDAYLALGRRETSVQQLQATLGAIERFGVTAGTMAVSLRE